MSQYLHNLTWAAAFLARKDKRKPLDTLLFENRSIEENIDLLHEFYGPEHMRNAYAMAHKSFPDMFSPPDGLQPDEHPDLKWLLDAIDRHFSSLNLNGTPPCTQVPTHSTA